MNTPKESTDGKRFLEGLILRAEDVLAKMIYKLHRTNIAVGEMVPMINSVYEFVNHWEGPLEDIKMEMLNLPTVAPLPSPSTLKAERQKALEDQIMEQIGQLDVRKGSGRKSPVVQARQQPVPVQVREQTEPIFECVEQSLKDYAPGFSGLGYLTYALPESMEFYMMDRTKGDGKAEKVLATLQNVTTRLDHLPGDPRTVFGVDLEGTIFRVVRSKASSGVPYIKLLDLGEITPYSEDMLLYQLPAYYQKFQPFAIRCQLVDVVDEPFCGDLYGYLKKNLYQIKKFEVSSRETSLLHVNLSAAPKQNQKKQLPTKMFENKPTPEPPREYKISEKTLTQEQLDILYEEPLSTSNAMKATMGFIPQDDRRICPFYDPAIQGCFKGASCRLEHVAKDTHGWTRDRALHKVKIRAQMTEPKLGSVLRMIPTVIVNVEQFYAHLSLKEYSIGLEQLQQRLNDPKYVREFRQMDHKPYKINRTGRCIISYVGPSERTFCIVDKDQPDSAKLIAAMQHVRGGKLDTIPSSSGEVFGVYLDGSLFRAVRNKPLAHSRLKQTYIRLLDTGEILPYDGKMELCSLSEYYRMLPAFAIRCMLVNVMDDPFCDDYDRYLKKNTHKVLYYKIASAEGPLLFLKLSQQPILPMDSILLKPPASAKSSPTKSKPSSNGPQKQRSLPASPRKQPPPRMSIFKPEPMDQGCTPASRSIRFPGTANTVAFSPEKPLCPFNGSQESSCTKGAHSKNGSAEKAHKKKSVVPPVGAQLYLMPKFIRDVEHFWCHVVSPHFASTDLLEMEMRMNAPETAAKYWKIQERPKFCQRVFAKYVDKRWYRAEVAEYYDDNNVLVFYVDYGNAEIVRLEEMRHWDEQFSYLPYQAILCRLAGVKAARENHTQAVVEMNRKLLNQRVRAKIVSNKTPWAVTIFDKEEFDFSTGLVIAGLAKKNAIEDEDDGDTNGGGGDDDDGYDNGESDSSDEGTSRPLVSL